jgi:Phosphotransferase enzyme family
MNRERLHGGRQTADLVRIGDTVRRPRNRNTEFVRAVLRHLESVGFPGAPRVLGVDEAGREILSFIKGDVHVAAPGEAEPRLSDVQLESAAALIRRFHDATAGTDLAGAEGVVCHGDLGPHNTVYLGTEAVGLIDWDEGVAPGRRLADLGHAVWCFVDVGEHGGPTAEQGRRIRLMCDAYGWDDPGAVVDEIAALLERARDRHGNAGRLRAAAIFEELMQWIGGHREALRTASGRRT